MSRAQNASVSDVEKGDVSHVDYPTLGRAPAPAPPAVAPTRLGNPGPLGLCSFATTTFLLSMLNLRTRGVAEPNVVVGMTLFVGGVCQLLAGMWEFAVGNTFGGTAFSSYGGFWLSYGCILLPGTGILAAYATPEAKGDLHNALGLFLTAWTLFTFLMWIATLRSNAALIAVFTVLLITFMLLAIGEFNESVAFTKAGGGMGVITAFAAWYTALAGLLRPDDAWFTLPVGPIPRRLD